MFIPAPTEANTAMFPASNWCPSSLPFRIRFNNVGIVATDEFPRFEMVMGMIEAGIFTSLKSRKTLFNMASSILALA